MLTDTAPEHGPLCGEITNAAVELVGGAAALVVAGAAAVIEAGIVAASDVASPTAVVMPASVVCPHAFANSNAKTTHCKACLIFQICELNEITEEKLDSVNCAVERGSNDNQRIRLSVVLSQ
jgi:hypothetical protein